MKLLLDCSLLTVGGGIQVGLSVVHNALKDSSLKVSLFSSTQMAAQLYPHYASCLSALEVSNSASAFGKFKQGKRVADFENAVSPDVVFSVFGPSYWRSKAVNLQGFALGKMLYPEERSNYLPYNLSRLKELCIDRLKIDILKHNVDYFVVETEVVKDRMASLFKIPHSHIYVVGNSYSPAFNDRCQELQGLKQDTNESFTFFVPASFYNHKNLEILPMVASILKQRGLRKFRFVFTLDSKSKGWARISTLASSMSVSPMFSTVGMVPNQYIADHYLAADAVICPSFVESSTAVFPEAFLSGRPLLVSDRDFSRQLCGDAALYFDPLDPQSIASALIKIVQDESLRTDLVYSGRDVLEKLYPSPVDKWEQQLQILKDVVERGKP